MVSNSRSRHSKPTSTEVDTDLRDRYCSLPMWREWQPSIRATIERQLWIAALEAQQAEGIEVDDDTLQRYRGTASYVGLESIREREERLGHEIAARIEEYNTVSGAQGIHQAMTSCDISDNATQVQVLRSARIVRRRSLSYICALRDVATANADLSCVAYTHNRAAQTTTWGRRVAMWLEEALFHHRLFVAATEAYPVRGLAGAVGTSRDLIALFRSAGVADPAAAAQRASHRYAEAVLAHAYHEGPVCGAPGQNYPRSIDVALARVAAGLTAAPTNMAVTCRLMAADGAATEGYTRQRVGSSAMPHKINPSRLERLNSLDATAHGHLHALELASRNRWYEGDVADSAGRRMALPGLWMSLEAVLLTATAAVGALVVDAGQFATELATHRHHTVSGQVLAEATRRGIARDVAYGALRSVYQDNGGGDIAEVVMVLFDCDADTAATLTEPGADLSVGQVQTVATAAADLLEGEARCGVHPAGPVHLTV